MADALTDFRNRPFDEPTPAPAPAAVPYDASPVDRGTLSDEDMAIPYDAPGNVIPTQAPSAEVAQMRSQKWDYGLGKASPGQMHLFRQISTGNEPEENKLQRLSQSFKDQQFRADTLDKVIHGAQGVYTPDTLQTIHGLLAMHGATRQDEDFLARKYAETYTNDTVTNLLNGTKPTEIDFKAMDFAERAVYLKEAIQKHSENLSQDYQAKYWLNKVYPHFEGIFISPLYNARMRSTFWQFTGNNLLEQYSRYFSMENPDEAIAEIKKTSNEMFKGNPLAALEFLNGFASYTSNDAAFKDLLSIVNTGLTVGGVVGGKLSYNAIKGVIKANGGRTTDFINVIEATGDTHKAAQGIALKLAKLEQQAADGAQIDIAQTYQDLKAMTIGFQQGTKGLEGNNFAGSREYGRRLREAMLEREAALDKNVYGGPIRVSRLDQDSQALQVARAEADAIFNRKYPNVSDKIADTRLSNLDDYITNNQFQIYRIGTRTPEEVTAHSTYAGGVVEKELKGLKLIPENLNIKLSPEEEKAVKRLTRKLKGAPIEDHETIRATILEIIKDNTKGYTSGDLHFRNTYQLQAGNDNFTTRIGNAELRGFETPESAQYSAEREFKFKDYTTVEYGGKWWIEVKQPLDETALRVRDQLGIETRQDNPRGWIRTLSNILPLSKDSKLHANVMEASKIGSYGLKNQIAFVNSFLEPIKALEPSVLSGKEAKKSWDNFKTFLDRQRMFEKDGEYGRFSRDHTEFEKDWQAEFGRRPTEKEASAYWSYVQLSDTDWVLNNLSIFRDKVRQGRENFHLPGVDQGVEGKALHNLPWDSKEPFSFAVWDKDHTQIRIYRSDARIGPPGSGLRNDLKAKLLSGDLKAFQVDHDAIARLRQELPDLPRGQVQYILNDEVPTSALKFNQIPYKPGGHRVYDYAYYARQPVLEEYTNVRRSIYYKGDINHTAFHTRADGEEYVRRFNEARTLLIEAQSSGDIAPLREYLGKNLPHSVERFTGFFDNHLNLNSPLYLTENFKNVDATHKLEDIYKRAYPNAQYIRSSESVHNLNNGQVNLRYAQERNDTIHETVNAGSKEQPVYNFQPAKMVDPVVTAHRAAQQIANSRVLDDLKIKAAEQFVAEYSGGLVGGIDRLRADPLQALLHAPIQPKISPAEKLAIADARRATKELLNIQTDFEHWVANQQQKVYETLVKDKNNSWTNHIPEWALSTIKAPGQALRQVAFQFKQGMLNPAAFVNQAVQVANIAAIETTASSPLRAVRSAISGQFMSMLRFWENDVAKIAHFAEKQSTFGMSKEHFIESFEALKESGFHKVGKETADYASHLKADLIPGKATEWLRNFSTFFFQRGEEMGRYTGWNAAYLRWREANPTALFDSAAKAEVLARADFLNLNMSGASNSVLQKGLQGVVTQFFTAHLRQMEQIAGGKLTAPEIARVLTMNSVLYGVPVGLAAPVTAYLWPVKQEAQQGALRNNWLTTDSTTHNLVMNGLLAVASKELLGTQLDTGQLGLGGISLMHDLLYGDKSALEYLSGVSGRTVKGLWESFYPFQQYILSTGERPLRREDFQDLLENVSSMGAFEKMYNGITVGKYYGKSEQRMDGITPAASVFAAFTGTQPQSLSEMSAMLLEKKRIESFQKEKEKLYALYVRRAFTKLDGGDKDGFHDFMDRANAEFQYGNFQPNKRLTMFRRAIQDDQALVDRVSKNFYNTLNTPEAVESYRRYLRNRNPQ